MIIDKIKSKQFSANKPTAKCRRCVYIFILKSIDATVTITANSANWYSSLVGPGICPTFAVSRYATMLVGFSSVLMPNKTFKVDSTNKARFAPNRASTLRS